MEKKKKIYWALSLSFLILVPLLGILYPLIYSSAFGYSPGFESTGMSVLLFSGIISLIFYALLVFDDLKELDTSSAIKKWWSVTWKWDLSIILFLSIVIPIFMGIFSFLAIVPIITFLFLTNGSIFLLTLLRKHISKEVFIIPASIALFILTSSLINNVLYPSSFSLKAQQFELGQMIDNFSIPFFIFFFVSIIANFISKPITKKLNKKISFILTLIFGVIGIIVLLIGSLFNFMKDTGDFIAIILLPLAILFYFVYLRKKK